MIKAFRAFTYAHNWGITYEDGKKAVEAVDLVRYLFGWSRPTCAEHVEYFIIKAKITDGDIDVSLQDAVNTFAPRRIEDLFITE